MASIALAKRLPVSLATRQRALFAGPCFVWGTTWLAMKIGIAAVPLVFAGHGGQGRSHAAAVALRAAVSACRSQCG